MIITVEEMKKYLRVDSAADDALITGMIEASEKHCMYVLRRDDASVLESCENGKIAVIFMTAYLYELREEADHHAMNLTLRALLFGDQEVGF